MYKLLIKNLKQSILLKVARGFIWKILHYPINRITGIDHAKCTEFTPQRKIHSLLKISPIIRRDRSILVISSQWSERVLTV